MLNDQQDVAVPISDEPNSQFSYRDFLTTYNTWDISKSNVEGLTPDLIRRIEKVSSLIKAYTRSSKFY